MRGSNLALRAADATRPKDDLLIVEAFNPTYTDYPRDSSIHRLFEQHVIESSEESAILCEDQEITYAELNSRANQLARRLCELGVGVGDRVAVLMARSPEMVIVQLSILKCGAVYVPVDPDYPVERRRFMVADCAARCGVFAEPAIEQHLPSSVNWINLTTDAESITEQSSQNLDIDVGALAPAYVMYTSGSTGTPKGVVVPHRAVVRLVVNNEPLRLDPGDCVCHNSNPAFDASTFEIWGPLLNRARMLVVPPSVVLDLRRFATVLEDKNVSVLWLTVGLFAQCADALVDVFRRLRILIVGGDVLNPELVRRVIARSPPQLFLNGYGPTECTTFSTVHHVDDLPAHGSTLPIGRPISNTQVYILDSNLHAVPIGTEGEIFIGGDGVALGYLNQPEATAGRFIADPVGNSTGGRLYRTGDLGRWREDGAIEFMGRNDSQVKIRGFRVEPGEIESKLLAHEDVKSAVVLPAKDSAGETRLVAYLAIDLPKLNSLVALKEGADQALVKQWEQLYENTYAEGDNAPSFVGWNSSYTGKAIPEDEMREWLDCTLRRIKSLDPSRVLEVGCGVGLLLERLAPQCDLYHATDFSKEAIERLQSWIGIRPGFQHVSLQKSAALDMELPSDHAYDTVIINSVVQYFPDMDYFRAVLRRVVSKVRDGGSIFIGDVRHFGLLNVFHSAVELARSEAAVSSGRLSARVSRAVEFEKELLIDPRFFDSIREEIREISRVRVLLKRGHALNELTLYRYDVVLEVRGTREERIFAERRWHQDMDLPSELNRQMHQENLASFRICGVRNRRLARDLHAAKLIGNHQEAATAGDIRRIIREAQLEGEDPAQFWDQGAGSGFEVDVSWRAGYTDGSFDLEVSNRQTSQANAVRTPIAEAEEGLSGRQVFQAANDPRGRTLKHQFLALLKSDLERVLPPYMVPSSFIALNELPLTKNGKVDRQRLAPPDFNDFDNRPHEPPESELEELVATIWKELLGVERVGRRDNFFDLGGHSLLVVQFLQTLRQHGLAAEAHRVLANPVLVEVTKNISRSDSHQSQITENRIPPACQLITPEMLSSVELNTAHLELIARTVPGGFGNIQDIYPLAPIQEGMLFHRLRADSDIDAYVHVLLLSFASNDGMDRVIDALTKTVARHDALRTSVLWSGLPRAVQVVHRSVQLPVEVLQLNLAQDPMPQLAELMKPEFQRMDLQRAPLMTLRVARSPDGGRCFALLQLHHVIHDLTSLDLLFDEVARIVDGHIRDLDEPTPYRHHVVRTLKSERLPEKLEFFRRKLRDCTEPTNCFDLQNAHVDPRRVVNSALTLDYGLSLRLRSHARAFGVSIAALFHAGWALVAAHTSRRDDVVFGTVLSGRLGGLGNAQRAMGTFINTLPIRLRLQNSTTIGLIRQSHGEILDLIKQEHAPLSVALQSSGVAGDAPLFNSLLNYVRKGSSPELGPMATLTDMRVIKTRNWTNYPIAVTVEDDGKEFRASVLTDRQLDPESVLGYFVQSMRSLVDALDESPSSQALDLPILAESERASLLQFNAETTAAPSDALIHRRFERQVRMHPQAVAAAHGQNTLTYAELDERANSIAGFLRQKGIGGGELVGLHMERGLDTVAAILGVLKAGGGYLPLDPRSPPDRLKYILDDATPKIVLTLNQIRQRLPKTTARVFAADEIPTQINQRPDPTSGDSPQSASSLAYVIYTSGSTGNPKGVMVEHRQVIRLFDATDNQLRFGNRDVWTVFHSFAFDFSVWELWGALLYGGQAEIVSESISRSPQEFYHLLCEKRVTILNQTPSAFLQLIEAQARSANEAKHSLRMVIFGGEQLDLRSLRSWVARNGINSPMLINMYGITETTVHVTYHRLTQREIESETASVIGRPISDLQVYVLDKRLQLAPVGIVGELHVGGPGVARGYLKRPWLTAERFIQNPFASGGGARLYKSGDLGRWRPDGILEYMGRDDGQVKIRGYRVELGEIEAQLVQHSEVKSAVVLVRNDAQGQKRLVAYMVPMEAGRTPTASSVQDHLKKTLPDYMVPRAIVFVDSFPLNSNGKLDRRALPDPELGDSVEAEFQAPRGATEKTLAEIIGTLVGVKRVGRNSSFFDLGGHSLLALKVIAKINESLNSTLRVSDLYQFPTVRELALHIFGEFGAESFIDLATEATLPETIRSLRDKGAEAAIFLTGCTGFVGRALLAQLLNETDKPVYCLVRARTAEEAMSRIRSSLSERDIWDERFTGRIVAIAGDLAAPGLGVDASTWQVLCEEVSEIYHCGASMNHLETYAMARPANVLGTIEVLRMATQVRSKVVNYISTLSIFNSRKVSDPRLITEQTPIDNERHLISDGYVGSKWVAEKLCLTAIERGIPCNVFRLGLIWADTLTGHYDHLQREYRVIKSTLLSGVGIENYKFAMPPTPVNYAARAIVALAKNHAAGGEHFHISSAVETFANPFAVVSKMLGNRVRLLPLPEWTAHLKALARRGQTLPIMPLIDMAEARPVGSLFESSGESEDSLDNLRTRSELEDLGIPTPEFIPEMLQIAVRTMLMRDPDLSSGVPVDKGETA